MTARLREPTVSEGLQDLYREISPHRGKRLTLSAEGVDLLADRLRLYVKLAQFMETELSVFRLGQADRDGRAMLERAAVETFRRLMTDPTGNVIWHDFGGKR